MFGSLLYSDIIILYGLKLAFKYNLKKYINTEENSEKILMKHGPSSADWLDNIDIILLKCQMLWRKKIKLSIDKRKILVVAVFWHKLIQNLYGCSIISVSLLF